LDDKTKQSKFFINQKARAETLYKISSMLDSEEFIYDEYSIKLLFAAAVEAKCRCPEVDDLNHEFIEIINKIKPIVKEFDTTIKELLSINFEIYSRARSSAFLYDKVIKPLKDNKIID
jgi:hypothetical protein